MIFTLHGRKQSTTKLGKTSKIRGKFQIIKTIGFSFESERIINLALLVIKFIRIYNDTVQSNSLNIPYYLD